MSGLLSLQLEYKKKVIHFKLKSINNVLSTDGNEMCWFWLTDASLWLKFGEFTIYEYSPEALDYFGDKVSPYNDYPLARFIEDFTQIFDKIAESIPDRYFNLIINLSSFFSDAESWSDKIDEKDYTNFYFNKYNKLLAWTYKRGFDSGHLTGGPRFYFFRNKDKIRIIWETEFLLENRLNIWTAKSGQVEMNYKNFIAELEDFGNRFFEAMDKQIELALKKNGEKLKSVKDT